MSAVVRIGLEVVVGSWAMGLALFAATLLLTRRLAHTLIGTERQALVVVVLLGSNYSLSAWATGGLGTMLQAFLVVVATLLAFATAGRQRLEPRLLAACSGLLALLLLARLDSAVVVVA